MPWVASPPLARTRRPSVQRPPCPACPPCPKNGCPAPLLAEHTADPAAHARTRDTLARSSPATHDRLARPPLAHAPICSTSIPQQEQKARAQHDQVRRAEPPVDHHDRAHQPDRYDCSKRPSTRSPRARSRRRRTPSSSRLPSSLHTPPTPAPSPPPPSSPFPPIPPHHQPARRSSSKPLAFLPPPLPPPFLPSCEKSSFAWPRPTQPPRLGPAPPAPPWPRAALTASRSQVLVCRCTRRAGGVRVLGIRVLLGSRRRLRREHGEDTAATAFGAGNGTGTGAGHGG